MQRRILLLSLIPLAFLFSITVTLARSYHARENALAKQWLGEGNAHMEAGRPEAALEDFRNALSYDPENDSIQLHLAESLLADNRLREARAYFVNLWDRSPGSGMVNLKLAQISYRMGDVDSAIRYYRGAMYGSWDDKPEDYRRNVRMELCELLLRIGRTAEAKSEIAGLAADAPPEDAILHEQTGRLFLRGADPARALAEFETALRNNPRQIQWLTDAGTAAYGAGDFPKAETYLAQVEREDPSAQIRELLESVREELRSDPFLVGLSDEEQARRSMRALHQGLERLNKCRMTLSDSTTAQQPRQELEMLSKTAKSLAGQIDLQTLTKQPESRNTVMLLVFRIENGASSSCGDPIGIYKALFLIGKRRADKAQ